MRTILLAGGLSMLATLLGTRVAIGLLVAKGYGQFIRDDGPTSHHTKRGTPTMGGLVIMLATVLGYLLAHLVTWSAPSASGLLLLYLFLGLGVVGFLDDFTKIRQQRSLGLDARAKLIGQGFVGLTFAVGALLWKDERGVAPASTAISFLRDISWLDFGTLGVIGSIIVVGFMMAMIAGASNGVNLTDGLDGLATGAATMVFAAYGIINIWQFNQSCRISAAGSCYTVRDPYDLAVVSLALAGACFGFLWWNAKPAKIFMGDSGSLSIGGALAGLAILTRTELLLVVLGGLFVIITLSVILQVGWFKATKGKRLFRMAPLQHHFELVGWQEVTIVIRFWIICGLCVALGLGLFYAQWVAGAV